VRPWRRARGKADGPHLPKNSTYTDSKTRPKPAGAARMTAFRIYRFNPDDGQNSRIDTYHVDRDDCELMVLDDRAGDLRTGQCVDDSDDQERP
jgi:hypothetical protein